MRGAERGRRGRALAARPRAAPPPRAAARRRPGRGSRAAPSARRPAPTARAPRSAVEARQLGLGLRVHGARSPAAPGRRRALEPVVSRTAHSGEPYELLGATARARSTSSAAPGGPGALGEVGLRLHADQQHARVADDAAPADRRVRLAHDRPRGLRVAAEQRDLGARGVAWSRSIPARRSRSAAPPPRGRAPPRPPEVALPRPQRGEEAGRREPQLVVVGALPAPAPAAPRPASQRPRRSSHSAAVACSSTPSESASPSARTSS